MIRNLLILPELPVIPPNSGIRHIASSYEVSKSPYMETTTNNVRDENAIIVSNLKDTVNLTSFNITVTGITEETEIYARHKLHYLIDGVEFDTGWSSIINMKGDQEGFRVADVIIQTPTLFARRKQDGIYRNYLEIDASEFTLFLGYGEHKSTTWKVTDTDNKTLFEVKRSVDLLKRLVIPIEDWNPNKCYIIQCQYHSTTNADSLWGKLLWCESSDIGDDVHFYIKNLPAIKGRDLLIGVRLHTSRMQSLDFTLKDPAGNIIASLVGHTDLEPKLRIPDTVLPNVLYTLYGRMKYTDGSYTNWKLVRSFFIKENTAIETNPDIEYKEEYTYVQNLIQPGTKFVYSREIPHLGYIMPKVGSDENRSLAIFQPEGGRLSYITDLVSDEDPSVIRRLSTWSIQVLPLFDETILVSRADSVSETDETGQGKLSFLRYSYNTDTLSLTLLNSIRPTNLFGSTGVSGSMVVTLDNTVYFVPAIEKKNRVDSKLTLRKLNVETMREEKVADLPFEALRHVSLVLISNTEFLVLGGMNDLSKPDPKDWVRSNDNIYKFNTVDKSFTKIASLENLNISKWNNLHAVLLKNGKVAIFNNSEGAGIAEDQSVVILNLEDGSVVKKDNDFSDGRMYLKTLIANNGNVYRISSSPLEPQQVYIYNTVGSLITEGSDRNDLAGVVTELIVPENSTVTIDNPYKFSKIKILGKTSDNTSGKLIWVDKRAIREFDADTLIVTKHMVLHDNTVDFLTKDKPYKNIFVLDGVDIVVNDDNITNPTDPTQE